MSDSSHEQLADPELLAQVSDLGGSVVVDADAARHRSGALELLSASGVDIANGGMGHGAFLRWNRAHNDVAKAGKILAQEAGAAPHEFCPGRRVDAFDQYLRPRAQAEAGGRQPHRAPR